MLCLRICYLTHLFLLYYGFWFWTFLIYVYVCVCVHVSCVFYFSAFFLFSCFPKKQKRNRLTGMNKEVGRFCEAGGDRRKHGKGQHYQNVLSIVWILHISESSGQQQMPIPIYLSCQPPKLIHFPLSIFWVYLCGQKRKMKLL